MKKLLQFGVAKYTPDLARMEPRNIGVVLWAHDGTTLARFLGERDDGTIHVPALVTKQDRHAYRQWIAYWRYQLNAATITLRSGESVPRTSEKFLEALRNKSKEQFRLVEGGGFAEKIPAKEIKDVLAELFSRLIERPQTEKARAELAELNEACHRLFKATGIEPLT